MDPTQYTWWNLLPFKMDSTFVTIFSSHFFEFGSSADGTGFPVRFYGMMYLFAFATCWYLIRSQIRKYKYPITDLQLEGFVTWLIGGILLGGRLGYVFFYNFDYYSEHITEIFWPFNNGHFTGIAGMSYHGGLIGACIGATIYLKKNRYDWLLYSNLTFLAAPLGYTWGRIGNFLNGELYGRTTDSAIGMIFPSDPTKSLRYPSQLFEAFGEGLTLFCILWFLRKIPVCRNQMPALYLMGYGCIRFIIEFFREPDAQLGLQLFGMSRGQELCATMFIAGVAFWIYTARYMRTHQYTH